MAIPLKLRVRNFLGVRRADIDLHGIVLVAGVNGAGKSSLIEAAACAALQTPLARGMTSKKAAAGLLTEGQEAGSISLDYGVGGLRIVFPSCEIEQSGKPETVGTSLGINSARFMGLKLDDRMSQIAQRFKTQPTIADLKAWIAEHPDMGLTPVTLDDGSPFDPVVELWERIEINGWDATHRGATEYGTKLKGRWEAITGQKWGSKIVKTWCPPELLPGEDYDINAIRGQAAAANAKLEEMIGSAAIDAAERERLERDASLVGEMQSLVSRLGIEADAMNTQAEGLLAKANGRDAPVDTSTLPKCPHCQMPIRITRDNEGRGYTFLNKAPAPLPAAELKKVRDELLELDEQIGHLQRALSANGTKAAEARAHLSLAEAARKELVRLQGLPQVDKSEVDRARGTKLELERKITAVDALMKATAVYGEWVRHHALLDALAVDGVRRVVMVRKLSALNKVLGEFSEVAKFSPIVLTDDLALAYDGRPYVLLSESERWRCNLVMAAALGQQEGAKILLVDRFDVLNPQARPGVLKMLKHIGVPTLICMTAREPSAVPDLEKFRLGTVRWLEKGTIVAAA